MKLKDNFFKIAESKLQDDNIDYIIQLNPEHFIYKAHFPDNPVTPGVCLIQIVQELAMDYIQRNLLIQRISKAKFTNVINPNEYNRIKISISIAETDMDTYRLNASIYNSNINFAQLTLELSSQN